MKIQKKVKSLNLINVDLINVYWSLFFSPCRCLLELNKFCREDTQKANYSTSCILCLYLSYTYFWPASNSLFQPVYIYIYIYTYTINVYQQTSVNRNISNLKAKNTFELVEKENSKYFLSSNYIRRLNS